MTKIDELIYSTRTKMENIIVEQCRRLRGVDKGYVDVPAVLYIPKSRLSKKIKTKWEKNDKIELLSFHISPDDRLSIMVHETNRIYCCGNEHYSIEELAEFAEYLLEYKKTE